MVIRVWTYRVEAEEAERFEEFERQFGLPMVQTQEGCLGVEFFRQYDAEAKSEADQSDYCMISRWDSRPSLEAALASTAWREEIALFQAQRFSDKPGTLRHYEQIA